MLGPKGLAEDHEKALSYPQRGETARWLPSAPSCASEAEPGWELPAARSAWPPPAPGSLTSWGALREEVPEKKQKPACLAAAALCLQPPAPPRLLAKCLNVSSRTQQAKEDICFSLKQLNAISIYIQMTAVQRERLFGWELGVPCTTTLFRVSVSLCYIIRVKIPVEVNNEGHSWLLKLLFIHRQMLYHYLGHKQPKC